MKNGRSRPPNDLSARQGRSDRFARALLYTRYAFAATPAFAIQRFGFSSFFGTMFR